MRRKRIANMTRAEVALLLEEEYGLRSTVRRAIQDGGFEFWGLFAIPKPTWIVAITGLRSASFVYITETNRDPVITWRNAPPSWSLWIGDEHPTPINLGDDPEQYKAWKSQAVFNLTQRKEP